MREIHAIQRDLFIVLTGLERPTETAINKALDEYYTVSIPTQKLEYHLNELSTAGYIRELEIDGNEEYVLTDDGRQLLTQHRAWENCLYRRETDQFSADTVQTARWLLVF